MLRCGTTLTVITVRDDEYQYVHHALRPDPCCRFSSYADDGNDGDVEQALVVSGSGQDPSSCDWTNPFIHIDLMVGRLPIDAVVD